MQFAASSPHPRLSVVIPFYEVEAYLEACLVSVRDQLLTDIEVILVDDGSTDGSRAIAERFVADDARFSLIIQDNAGLGPARNTGAERAQGTYLTFVDSDDLVAPRGFAQLIGSLDATGSDFAAGNAKRFSSARGSYQSWTHEEAFAHTELRTSLARRPDLIRDRMVWNKVYRRSFWNEHAYAFPAIRYEDYPVTLRAYLEADSIDVLADHVYFWRDRESGTSITQQTGDLANATDRFTSAEMVLDVLKTHAATDDVIRRVTSYLARVDVVSLAQTMVAVPEASRAKAEALALALADHIDPASASDQTRISRLIHTALRDRDMTLARSLANWRTSGHNAALVRDVAATKDPRSVFAVARAVVASKAPQSPLRARRLKSHLTDARWDGADLVVTLETTLRARLAHRCKVTVSLVSPDGRSAGVDDVSVTPIATGLRTVVRVAGEQLTAASTLAGLAFEVSLRPAGVKELWRGPVTGEPHRLPAPRTGPPAWWLRFGERGLELATGEPAVVSLTATENAFTVRIPTATPASRFTELAVHLPSPSPDVVVPIVDGVAAVDAHHLVEVDVADDPVTGTCERAVVLRDENGLECSPLVSGGEAVIIIDGVHLTVGRCADATLGLRRTPVVDEHR